MFGLDHMNLDKLSPPKRLAKRAWFSETEDELTAVTVVAFADSSGVGKAAKGSWGLVFRVKATAKTWFGGDVGDDYEVAVIYQKAKADGKDIPFDAFAFKSGTSLFKFLEPLGFKDFDLPTKAGDERVVSRADN